MVLWALVFSINFSLFCLPGLKGEKESEKRNRRNTRKDTEKEKRVPVANPLDGREAVLSWARRSVPQNFLAQNFSMLKRCQVSFVLIFFFVSLPIIGSPQSRKSKVYMLISPEAGRKGCSCDIQGCLCCNHESSQRLNFLGLVFKIFIFCQVTLNLVVFPVLMDSLYSPIVPGTKSI